MRRECDSVDHKHGTSDSMYGVRNGFDIMDCAQQVASMCTCHQPRSFAEQWHQRLRSELRIQAVPVTRPPSDLQRLALSHGDPRRDVGLVVQLRDDDLIAGQKLKGIGQVAEELSC